MSSPLPELLFELSSGDRLALLRELGDKRQRTSQLAPSISATIQETSRQLNRLHDAGFIERDPEGYYGLTCFGRAVLGLVPSLDFLSKNRAYFLKHDLSAIPHEFLERIGELSSSQFGQTAGTVLRHSEEVLGESGSFVWLLADHAFLSIERICQAVKGRNVQVRIISPETDDSADRREAEEAKEILQELLEVRSAEGIAVAIAMNEQKAGVAFPDSSGRVDYNAGFRGADRTFHSWCHDFFTFYWGKSKRVL